MDKVKTIYLEKEISSIISSREVFSIIEKLIKESNSQSINLDFFNVDFISRSAAHELILLKEKFRSEKVSISFINTNKDVEEMIRIIASNRALPKSQEKEFNPQVVKITELLNNL